MTTQCKPARLTQHELNTHKPNVRVLGHLGLRTMAMDDVFAMFYESV